jgi:hypothetical protein
VNCFYFLCFSLFVDLYWIYFWGGNSDNVKDIEKAAHVLIIFLSFIGILVKILVSAAIAFKEWDSIKGSLPNRLLDKLNVGEENKEDF